MSLNLGQVGTMVLAVTQLHQPPSVDGVVAVAGGGVEADPLEGQVIDVAGGLPEVGFQAGPAVGSLSRWRTRVRRSSVKSTVRNGLARDGFEGVVEVVGPVADVGLAVVGLGEDVRDPDW